MSFTSARDVYLLAVARGVSFLGDFMAATAIVLALQERGAGGPAVAAVLIASVVPVVALAPLVGRLVDRVDSRVLLTVVGLGQAACCTAMALTTRTWLLITLVGLLAAGVAITTPTFNALLPDMAGPDGVGRAMAIGQTANSVGSLAGPALAGVFVGAFGLRIPLLIDAATYLAVVAAGLLLHTRRKAAAGGPGGGRTGWKIREDRFLLAMTCLVGAIVLTINVDMVVGVFFIRETLGAAPAEFGLVEAAWTAGMLAGGWIAAARARDDGALGRLIVLLHVVTAAVVLASGFVGTVLLMYPLWLLGGAANGAENNFLGVIAARRVPGEVRGAFFARFGAVINAANLLGYAAGGVLVGRFEPRQIVIGCGVAGLVAVAIFGGWMWRVSAAAGSAAASSLPGTSSSRSPSPACSGSAP
ncbi:MFS transporter [Dactylosporangium aurantiacum]|uniref:MFS transporter n=1 Tax=Dactylosporangium aurantiacum TaxID=35754 RepID=A0A9Q9MJN9_9ACTN|nr:MFS transporter [Dactylosporangium aurantiacum]MDG6101081.1 MFS transporter [Dactylosporangium aurantiacum]UWZ54881.1 MFS transporter [Dactylosporangium aurantiacum]